MDHEKLLNGLRELGGCGVIALGWTIFAIGYLIYWFASGGNPEVVKFRNECYRQQTQKYLPGEIPDDVIQRAVFYCEDELRKHLGLRP